MRVVVENKVEVSADITPEMIEAYLMRKGCEPLGKNDYWHEWGVPGDTIGVPMKVDARDWARCARRCVEAIADIEGRQPGDVLLDIAKEGSEFRGVLHGIESLDKS